MVEHMVLLKFAAKTTVDERLEVQRKLSALKEQLPGIVEMHVGDNFSKRGKGFQIGLLVRFESTEALAAYGPHPLHQAVYQYMESVGLEDIIAIDFEHESHPLH